MIRKSINLGGVVVYTTNKYDKVHNPHGPAIKTRVGSFDYYINNNLHNIVGLSRSNIRFKEYAINDKIIRYSGTEADNTLFGYQFEDDYQ